MFLLNGFAVSVKHKSILVFPTESELTTIRHKFHKIPQRGITKTCGGKDAVEVFVISLCAPFFQGLVLSMTRTAIWTCKRCGHTVAAVRHDV